jgi:hypothetical protein
MPGKPPGCERSRCSRCDVPSTVELQRDWAREETVTDVMEIVLTERMLEG